MSIYFPLNLFFREYVPFGISVTFNVKVSSFSWPLSTFLARMVAVPGATVVTWPVLALTVATLVLEEDHSNVWLMLLLL